MQGEEEVQWVVGGCPAVIWCHKAVARNWLQQGGCLWVGAAWVGTQGLVRVGKEQGAVGRAVGSRRRGRREEGMRQGLLLVAAVKEAGCSQA